MISRTVCHIRETLFPTVRTVFAYSIGLSVRYAGCHREFTQRQFGEGGGAPGGDLRLADFSRLINSRRGRKRRLFSFGRTRPWNTIDSAGCAPLKPEEWYRT
jgi:hypothetical protein